MSKLNDIKFAIQYAKDNPKEAAKLVAQATVITVSAGVIMVLAVKGATVLAEELKNK